MKQDNVRNMCLAGIFTAVVFVFTAYLHVPSYTGYTHVGDGFIFLSACLLPTPYAVFVGAGGALLADCMTGYALWAPGSVIIKLLTVLCFTTNSKRILTKRNLLALLPAAVLGIGGYYLYESLVTGNFAAALAGIPGYVMQAVLSSGLFVVLGGILDQVGIKRLLKSEKQNKNRK